jgi:hypothetical protein
MAKHYVRIDSQNRIIKGFSADFEQPQDTDICINADGGRQFELNGVINPSLINRNEVWLYKYVDGTVSQRSAEEVQSEIDAINNAPKEPTDKARLDAVEAAISALMGV